MCWVTSEKSIVANVGKCSWGRCIFCGWGKLRGKDNINDLMSKIEKVMLYRPRRVKIYTSGSLFDDFQFPREFRIWLAERLDRSCVEELQVESLPDYISYETLQPFLRRSYNLIVALGLEVADNEALKKLGKYPAMTVEKYIASVNMLRNLNVRIKTYVLVNPPLRNWIELFRSTMELSLRYSDEVVVINTYPHAHSPLFKMWIDGLWKPLSLEEFMMIVKDYVGDPRVQIEFSNFGFRPKFPNYMKKKIVGANKSTLLHPYYEVWMDYFERFYKPPKSKDILLFVPCSFKKPYYKSKTWKAILNTLRRVGMRRRTHLVAVSSPGVVPEEFANEYPFNSYDWPEWEETDDIKRLYVDVVASRVKRYLRSHASHYKAIAVYLKPDSESFEAVMRACNELNLKCIPCLTEEAYNDEVKNHKPPVTHPQALESLKECLISLKQIMSSQNPLKMTGTNIH